MRHKAPEILSGNITVSGKDKIEIELGDRRPKTVIVEFKDRPNPTPCNPHHDHLDWHCMFKRRQYVLIVNWDVFDTREVIWAVEF
jgi:hypothetical protein